MPLEVHEHFNADGESTGTTVVHRESVWNDSARARALQLIEFEQSIDSHTNLPYAEAYKDQRFVVTDVDNYAAIAMEQQRLADEEDAKHHPNKYPKGWAQGRRYVVRPATAEELLEAGLVEEVLGGD